MKQQAKRRLSAFSWAVLHFVVFPKQTRIAPKIACGATIIEPTLGSNPDDNARDHRRDAARFCIGICRLHQHPTLLLRRLSYRPSARAQSRLRGVCGRALRSVRELLPELWARDAILLRA